MGTVEKEIYITQNKYLLSNEKAKKATIFEY